MKKVVLVCTLTIGVLSLVACKETSTRSDVAEPQQEETQIPQEELAIAEVSETSNKVLSNIRYVTAPSGLTLREFNNLQSEKIAKMPYGTKVVILQPEGKNTMKVAGIPGAMDQVAFNHKTGYAFNGYLSKYFPPERDITVAGYAEELKAHYPEVVYEHRVEGSTSKPITLEILKLPEAKWHEAFIVAQRLFDFPKEFAIPSSKGKDSQIVQDNKPKKGIWTSQLEIQRKDDQFQEIAYVYTSEKFLSRVSITQDGNTMKIVRKETIR